MPAHDRPDRPAGQQDRRRAEFEASQRRIASRRARIGLLVLVPLAVSLLCGSQIPVPFACDVPREIWLAAYAAIVGAYVGTWIRQILERRRFEREVRASTS